MGERCLILLNSIKNKNFDKNNILDTSNLSVEEALKIAKSNHDTAVVGDRVYKIFEQVGV